MLKAATSCCRRGVRGFSSSSSDALYLGLDSSTQGLKATAINGSFEVVSAFAINYQKDLPHYALTNGVHASAGNVVTQPTLMVRAPPPAAAAIPAARHARRNPPPPAPPPPLPPPPPALTPRSTWRRWTSCFPT